MGRKYELDKSFSRTNREVIRFGRMGTRSLEIVYKKFVICRVAGESKLDRYEFSGSLI